MMSSARIDLKRQYSFNLVCAQITGSKALIGEVNKQRQQLEKDGVVMDDKSMNSALRHWLRVYDVGSKVSLISDPRFISTCKYNACVTGGNDQKECSQEKIDSCLLNNISLYDCIGSPPQPY